MKDPLPPGSYYVFVSRVVNPAIGFSNSFTYFFFQATLAGAYFSLLNYYAANYLTTLGLVTGTDAYSALAAALTTPTWILILGTVMNIIILGLAIGGLRISKTALLAMELIGWLGLVVALGILLTANQATFAAAWNKYLGSQITYENALSKAQSGGLQYMVGIGPLLGASVWGFFSITGYQGVGYLGGEVKRGQRNMILAMVLGLLVIVFMMEIGTFIILNTMGYDFIAGAAYLNSAGTLSTAPYFTTAAALLLPNPFLITFIYLGLFLWIIALQLGFYLILTRQVFAWSFDRVVPTLLANVSEKFHSPTWSTILIGVMLEVGILLSLYSTIGVLLNLSLVLVLCYSIGTLSTALLPVLKPAVFANAPRVVNYKLGGKVPVISITGGLATIFFWILAYEAVINPSITGAVTPVTVGVIGLVAVIGFIIYAAAYYYNKSRGISLSLVFKEVPPE